MRIALIVLSLFIAFPASAQLGRLPVGVPSLPPVAGLPVVGNLPGIVDRTEDAVGRLASRRLDQIDSLLSRHRDVLERSPDGDLIVRNQVVAMSPTPEALAAIQGAGFTVSETQTLDGLGTQVVILTVPRGISTKSALRKLQKLDPGGTYDFNDIYLGSQAASGAASGAVTLGEGGGRVGLIDGGVDAGHPAFRGAHVVQQGFAGKAVPSEHGTATGSLLVGRADGFAGAAPGAELLVADVYCNSPTGGSSSAILQALDWMARQQVAVINISLVGPANGPMRVAIATLVKRGYLIVAAVGNDGPAAKPLYPAAFDGVVGVTGVDKRNKALLEAGRGPQVDFAAPGSDIAAATPSGGYVAVRGTSFSAPIAAGLLAQRLPHPDPAQARAAVAALSSGAVDLGAKGIDTTYGAGLVGNGIRPDIQTLKTKK